jgi:hypothetical protein
LVGSGYRNCAIDPTEVVFGAVTTGAVVTEKPAMRRTALGAALATATALLFVGYLRV